jgi:hypothetical protein
MNEGTHSDPLVAVDSGEAYFTLFTMLVNASASL